MLNPIVTLAAMLLIPIVPAYVLFRALPSTADAEGPLQGLKIKLGGAFAGYFVVLLVVFTMRNDWAPASASQVWQVEGTLLDENGAPLKALQPSDFHVAPTGFEDQGAGRFQLKFFTSPGPMGDGQFPTIDIGIEHLQYAEVPINLDDSDGGQAGLHLTRDDVTHTIKIDPIRLKKFANYAGTGTPPAAEQENTP